MAEVVEGSSFSKWKLWKSNLNDCVTRWEFLKGTDNTTAHAANTANETKEIYLNRVAADELAIKACQDFEDFVKSNITDPWTANATKLSKNETEVVLGEFPKLQWEAAEKQYIHDYIKAEKAQAKTLLALHNDDA